jgi:ABC-type multidrug transport system ATPase subunit
VRRGDVYALVGGHGAGKTVVVRLLLGLVRPTGGDTELLGARVRPDAVRLFERVGYVDETPEFHPPLTVQENLDLQRRLLGLRDPGVVDSALGEAGAERVRDRKAGRLTAGERRRAGIARALLAQPELLVLDEPTRDLDAAGVRDVSRLVERLSSERGATVLMCTLADAAIASTATRLGILRAGRLAQEISRSEIAARSRAHVEVVVSDTARAAWLLEEELGITDFAVCEEGLIRVYGGLGRAAEVNSTLLDDGVEVSRLTRNEETLQEFLERLIADDGGDA